MRNAGPWPRHVRTLRPSRGDLVGGFTAAVVLLAMEGSFGIVALAPLGPALAPLGFMLGIFAAVLGNLVALLFGARGPLLGGSSGALALLVPPYLAVLLADPRFQIAQGAPNVPLLLAFLAVGVMAAGLLQLAAGALRIGRLFRHAPYPVHAGFMNGVAILMTVAMLPHALGLPDGVPLSAAWAQARPATLAVTALTLWLALRPPGWLRAVPTQLGALLVGCAVHYGLAAWLGADALGPAIGPLPFEWPNPTVLAPLAEPTALTLLRSHAGLVLQFAALLMVTATLQTLFASSVIDGLTHQRRDGERLLRAHGGTNLVVGLFGLPLFAGSVSRSIVSLRSGGHGTASAPVFSLCLLGLLMFGTGAMRWLPMDVIAGLFIAGSFGLVDAWSRRATVSVLRHAMRRQRLPAPLATSYAVMLAVVLASVLATLAVGVGLGIALSIVMFIRSNMRPPVRSVTHADRRPSRKVRPADSAALLKAHGRRIAIIELDGALFFGTADAAASEIARVAALSEQIVIDFRRVSEVDASGARVLLQAASQLKADGKVLWLASLAEGDARRTAIRSMDLEHVLADDHVFPDADRALECAEDRLLQDLAHKPAPGAPLPLAQTMLGSGLGAAELDILAPLLVARRLTAGERVFSHGDAGDSLCVATFGQIGIWLPAVAGQPARRLVSFAPGVVFGEMGLLRGTPRSADALVEEDALVLTLPRAQFEQLAAHHPRLHATLLLNLSLHLSARLGALTEAMQDDGGLN